MISHVKFVSIPVSDQDRALKFYTEKLGFKVEADVPIGNGLRWIKLVTPNGETRVVLFTMEGHEDRIGSSSNVVFATADVQKCYDELREKGVEFTSAPIAEAWGTYVQFKDPDGNSFILSASE